MFTKDANEMRKLTNKVDTFVKKSISRKTAVNENVQSKVLNYINVYKNQDGSFSYSSEEFSVDDKQGLLSLKAAEQDLYDWIRLQQANYVSTLSNDGIDHTANMNKLASEIEFAMAKAGHEELQYDKLDELIQDYGYNGSGADNNDEHRTY